MSILSLISGVLNLITGLLSTISIAITIAVI